ncbi:conserved hypothetical protein [Ricinus communis]|uniref:Uncharacterized protein n=1 Tax=Ricinus communis TaxID=3988 RepID=B9TGE7_RICCO|nr:conserved hypothetical protein [Ricinus communis]
MAPVTVSRAGPRPDGCAAWPAMGKAPATAAAPRNWRLFMRRYRGRCDLLIIAILSNGFVFHRHGFDPRSDRGRGIVHAGPASHADRQCRHSRPLACRDVMACRHCRRVRQALSAAAPDGLVWRGQLYLFRFDPAPAAPDAASGTIARRGRAGDGPALQQRPAELLPRRRRQHGHAQRRRAGTGTAARHRLAQLWRRPHIHPPAQAQQTHRQGRPDGRQPAADGRRPPGQLAARHQQDGQSGWTTDQSNFSLRELNRSYLYPIFAKALLNLGSLSYIRLQVLRVLHGLHRFAVLS